MQSPQFQVHADLEEHHWWFLARRRILRSLLHRCVPPSKRALILDVGCGTGGNTKAFADEYSCIGIDPVPEAIAAARTRFPGIDFRTGYAPDDIADDMRKADVVLLMDVLEHVEDDFALVSGLLRGMKPGAHLILMAPGDPGLWGPHDRGFEHYRRYDLARLRMLWKDLPASERVLSYCNARLYWPVRLARAWTRMRGRSLGAADTDIALPPAPVNRLLCSLFASEGRVFAGLFDGKRRRGFRHGVSVFAVVRREEGAIAPRKRPANLPPDPRPWHLPPHLSGKRGYVVEKP